MNPKSKVPQIRFKGFNGDWEEKELGSVCTFFSGGTPTSSNKSYYEGVIPFIGSGKISDESVDQFITEEALKNSSAKLVKKGDLLYALYGATSGEVAISKIDGAINQAVLCIRNQEETYFLLQWLLLNKKSILSTYLQGGQGNLSAQIIKSLTHHIPLKLEQTKIGNYFQQLDELIEQKEKKHQKFKQFKKAMLSKMFPKNGAATPEIRFKGFSGEWDIKKFGECALIQRGGSPRPIEKFITQNENGINWIKIGDVSTGSRYITQTKEKIIPEGEKNSRKVLIGDLILSNSMSFGRPYIMAIEGCIHDGWLLIRDEKKMFTLEYLLQLLSSDYMINQYKALASGGVVINLNSELVQSTNVYIPNIDEQTKIGNYFQKLDSLIDLQLQELQKLKNIKKASLAKMFA
jgi:type I restriction enzyme S subunit